MSGEQWPKDRPVILGLDADVDLDEQGEVTVTNRTDMEIPAGTPIVGDLNRQADTMLVTRELWRLIHAGYVLKLRNDVPTRSIVLEVLKDGQAVHTSSIMFDDLYGHTEPDRFVAGALAAIRAELTTEQKVDGTA